MTHRSNQLRLVTGAALLTAVLGLGPVAAQHSVTPPVAFTGDESTMARFYSGAHSPIGSFKGKLVCLRCDLAHAPGSAGTCKQEGHRHALSMDDGSMIHPLMGGTEETLAQINSDALHAKEVVVTGRYYPSTGAILVSGISLQN